MFVTGPLASFVESYSVELRRRGYTERSAVGALRQVGRLSRWLEASGLSAAELSRERVEQFLVWQRDQGRHRCQWSRPGLVCLLDVLDGLGVRRAEAPAPASSAIDVLLSSFERYLVSERGLAAGTIVGYVSHARWFLEGLGSGGVARLSAAEVTGAVLRKASSGVSVSAAQNFVSGLRAFLRFCFVEGIVERDLSQAALVVRGRRASLLPRGISSEHARALLGSCDRRRPLGRRDYALIILLLRLGLRRGEVAALTLDDIDWRAGELVIHGKGGRDDRLPLPADVGRGDRRVSAARQAGERSPRGVPARPCSVCADRVRDGRLDRPPGVPPRGDPGSRLAPTASHDRVRDGRGRGTDRAGRAGPAAQQPAEHRDLRARGYRAAAAARRAMAGR